MKPFGEPVRLMDSSGRPGLRGELPLPFPVFHDAPRVRRRALKNLQAVSTALEGMRLSHNSVWRALHRACYYRTP